MSEHSSSLSSRIPRSKRIDLLEVATALGEQLEQLREVGGDLNHREEQCWSEVDRLFTALADGLAS